MGELSKASANFLPEPGLLTCQRQIWDTHRLLMEGAGIQHTAVEFLVTPNNPGRLRRALYTDMEDMFTPSGSLFPDASKCLPLLGDVPQIALDIDTVPESVIIGTWGKTHTKRRFIDATASQNQPSYRDQGLIVTGMGRFVKVEWPDEEEWGGNVSLTFRHTLPKDGYYAAERLMIMTDYSGPGTLPRIQSLVVIQDQGRNVATAYQQSERIAYNEAEVIIFLELLRDLKQYRRG